MVGNLVDSNKKRANKEQEGAYPDIQESLQLLIEGYQVMGTLANHILGNDTCRNTPGLIPNTLLVIENILELATKIGFYD